MRSPSGDPALRILPGGGYSDVVREAQELVELALKGMLRAVGIDPPKVHEVGGALLSNRDRFLTPRFAR